MLGQDGLLWFQIFQSFFLATEDRSKFTINNDTIVTIMFHSFILFSCKV